MQEFAKQNGGKCLSKRYINNITKLKWQCKKGHIWNAKYGHMKIKGNWCPECSGKKKRTIEEMQEIAKQNGGKCLSKVYLGIHVKLKWQCKEGHIWYTAPAGIKNRGNWCSICASYKSEKITRKYMEILFGVKFKKYKPIWLKIKKRIILELDGYNKEKKIAFEYDGEQHYRYVNFNSKKKISKEKQNFIFQKIKKYDKLKDELCKKHKIFLIRIPYIIKHKDIGNYIINVCDKNNVEVPFRNLLI